MKRKTQKNNHHTGKPSLAADWSTLSDCFFTVTEVKQLLRLFSVFGFELKLDPDGRAVDANANVFVT